MEEYALRLKKLRKEKDVTQEELAAAVGRRWDSNPQVQGQYIMATFVRKIKKKGPRRAQKKEVIYGQRYHTWSAPLPSVVQSAPSSGPPSIK